MAGVFLVFQIGQPRIWMTMSRDGLLPKRFSRIHPRFKTPAFATIVTGFFVVVPMLFVPSDTVLDLCSMGTLFAFVLVCAGVLKLEMTPGAPRGKFRTPYINGKWVFPAMVLAILLFLMTMHREDTLAWLRNDKVVFNAETIMSHLTESEINSIKTQVSAVDSEGFAATSNDLAKYLGALDDAKYASTVAAMNVPDNYKFESGWALFQHKIPMWLFIFTCLYIMWLAIRHSLSLIPMLGLVFCFYMMAQIPAHSWLGFFIWLLMGLVIYFGYGYRNSKLHRA